MKPTVLTALLGALTLAACAQSPAPQPAQLMAAPTFADESEALLRDFMRARRLADDGVARRYLAPEAQRAYDASPWGVRCARRYDVLARWPAIRGGTHFSVRLFEGAGYRDETVTLRGAHVTSVSLGRHPAAR